MVQPVSSEARRSLISGVLPIASMTSWRMVMSLQEGHSRERPSSTESPPMARDSEIGHAARAPRSAVHAHDAEIVNTLYFSLVQGRKTGRPVRK
jgi:hypothetical protein